MYVSLDREQLVSRDYRRWTKKTSALATRTNCVGSYSFAEPHSIAVSLSVGTLVRLTRLFFRLLVHLQTQARPLSGLYTYIRPFAERDILAVPASVRL